VSVYPVVKVSIAQGDTMIMEELGIAQELEVEDVYMKYNWMPKQYITGDTTDLVSVNPPSNVIYIIEATDSNECNTYDTILVRFIGDIVPVNAFSPNDDGVNDLWDIDEARYYDDIEVYVFNRWSQPVFHSKGYSDGQRWNGTKFNNGKQLPVGTYYYVIEVEGEIFKGPVTIVR
jgi:gliding motility-associated-like protein